MKRLVRLCSVLIFFCVMVLSALTTYAMSPMPTSFVEETTIAGIVPVGSEEVVVNQAKFDVDFITKNELPVETHIEKSAKLTMAYDLTYTGSNSLVKFSLPLLNKLKYLDNGVRVLVDGVEVNPKLKISPTYKFRSYGSYTRMLEEDFFVDYRENMIDDYEFLHDVDGYQYTVKNPKTKGKRYLVDTTLRFVNVPTNTVFMDMNTFREDESDIVSFWGTYKAEEEFVFFSSSELYIVAESLEVEEHRGYYTSQGERLDNPKITKKEMKLSQHLEQQSFKVHKFLNTKKALFYHIVDQQWDEASKFHVYKSRDILEEIDQTYYEMSLEFDVDFYKPQMQVELQLPIPVHCYYKDMTLEVVVNPAQMMTELKEATVNIHIEEELLSSSGPHRQSKSNYEWIVEEGATLKVVYANSSYKNGLAFLGVFILLGTIFLWIFRIIKFVLPGVLIGGFIVLVFHVYRRMLKKKKE